MSKRKIRYSLIVERYWKKYFARENGICSLCGNSGSIDTRSVVSAANVAAGRLNYCICPNGQVMRQQTDAKESK